MQALSTLALQSNVSVTEDIVDELVHRWLFELAPSTGLAAERRRALDLLR